MLKDLKPKQLKELLQSMVIIIDTREQKNSHILKYFDENDIKYISKKLDCGDYSFYVPANECFDISEDIWYNKDIVIERKNSVDEIVGNFATDKDRLEREFARHGGKMVLMIEEERFYDKLHKQDYRNNINSKSAVGIFHSLMDRYNIQTFFIKKELAGKFIYYHFYYYLRNKVKT